jgi:phosphatidylserine/phosphatidylglycerophosphate/cardiolipin synthase-like enzyme
MSIRATLIAAVLFVSVVPAARAADEYCESAATDCRARLLYYINRESIGIDVGTLEISDPLIVDALIARFRAGVAVRLIVEPRRNWTTPAQVTALERLAAAGIPMRYKPGGYIVHWKMMVFAGQHRVQFGEALFTTSYLVPVTPYVDFYQDPLYFTDIPALVTSFQRAFDDAWVDTVNFANLANAASAPVRTYPLYPIDPSINLVPFQNFATRSRPLYDAETQRIDAIVYKVTDAIHADAMIRAVRRGVPVRLVTEPLRYRDSTNVWHAYHLDRMYAAGVQVRERAHRGFLHQKTTLLYGQGRTIYGSGNWTTESSQYQYEQNYFATSPSFFEWFRQVFERKWTTAETKAFVPQPPGAPTYTAPANAATGQPTTVTLTWRPGPWGARADVYFGTTANPPPLYRQNLTAGPNGTARLTIAGLVPGTRYYWGVVSKTMAGAVRAGTVWSFVTG